MIQYIKESFAELKNNVTWPTWAELQSSTWAVAIATVVFALVIYVMDKGVYTVLNTLFEIAGVAN